MQLEVKAHVFDIVQAGDLLLAFTVGRNREEYLADPYLRSTVERQLEIIGEATSKLAKLDSVTASKITDYRKLISFRNVLIHGYADIDNELVWDLIQSKLALLLDEVRSLQAKA